MKNIYFDCRKDYLALYGIIDDIFTRKKNIIMTEANKFYDANEIGLLDKTTNDIIKISFNPYISGSLYFTDYENISLNFNLADPLLACVAHHEFSHSKDISDALLDKDFLKHDIRYFRSEIRAYKSTLRNISTLEWERQKLKHLASLFCLRLIDHYQNKIQSAKRCF